MHQDRHHSHDLPAMGSPEIHFKMALRSTGSIYDDYLLRGVLPNYFVQLGLAGSVLHFRTAPTTSYSSPERLLV